MNAFEVEAAKLFPVLTSILVVHSLLQRVDDGVKYTITPKIVKEEVIKQEDTSMKDEVIEGDGVEWI